MEAGWSRVGDETCISVRGCATSEVRVYPTAARDGASGLPPMAGRVVVDDDGVRFIPRFPFVDGIAYTVVAGDEELTISRPARAEAPTTAVVDIHPTSAEVPRNHLRFYVRFSAPMSEGMAAGHVHVVDAATGEEMGAVLPLEPELWDPDHTRLTVLLDPARIKRGLAPHRAAGYPLREGQAIGVVVDRSFRDAAGQPLCDGFAREYLVGPDVRSHVDPSAWTVVAPAVGSTAPLLVTFDRPLDHALLQHCLAVRGPGGAAVAGRVDVDAGEASWRFVPGQPWSAGRHQLDVDAILEDLAGNSVTRVFDRELAEPAHAPRRTDRVSLRFDPT